MYTTFVVNALFLDCEFPLSLRLYSNLSSLCCIEIQRSLKAYPFENSAVTTIDRRIATV